MAKTARFEVERIQPLVADAFRLNRGESSGNPTFAENIMTLKQIQESELRA